MRKVFIDANKVVIITENAGGYLAGRCLCCDAGGWLDGHGYPFRMKNKVMGNHLVHRKDCPMNNVLDDKGAIKK